MSDDAFLDKDYRAYFDYTYLRPWELAPKRDFTVTIERVERHKIGAGKKAEHKPVLFFRGKSKGLVCNKGMSKCLKGMYGKRARGWLGKRIDIYVTTDTFGDEVHDVIRIRPTVPVEPPKNKPAPPELPPKPPVADAEFTEEPSTVEPSMEEAS